MLKHLKETMFQVKDKTEDHSLRFKKLREASYANHENIITINQCIMEDKR